MKKYRKMRKIIVRKEPSREDTRRSDAEALRFLRNLSKKTRRPLFSPKG
jgi:hypothetical protein